MRHRVAVLAAGLVLVPSASAHRGLGVTRDLSGGPAGVTARQMGPAAGLGVEMPSVALAYGVTYGGGPVLRSNRTHVIFWAPRGSYMSFDPGYRALVQRFLADTATASHSTSNMFAITGQYTDSAHRPAAYDSHDGGAVLDTERLPSNQCVEPATSPGWKVCLTDAQLQSEIDRVVRAHHLPATQHDVYLLVTPRGFGSCMDQFASSGCALGGSLNGYCGYHSVTTNHINYAFIPYNAVPGHCQSNNPRPNGNSADPALSTVSHELAEMITDPDGNAWTNGSEGEIGDLCISTFGSAIGGSGSRRYNESIAGGHYFLQEEWSNADGGCRPRARPDAASFVVSARSGQTLTFKGAGTDPEPYASIASFHWSFGAGEVAAGQSVTHHFPKAGRYSVRLRVTDSWDNWGYYTRAVSVT
jgi:hypothetical protein